MKYKDLGTGAGVPCCSQQHTVLPGQFHTNAALRDQAAAKHAASQKLVTQLNALHSRSVIPNPVAPCTMLPVFIPLPVG